MDTRGRLVVALSVLAAVVGVALLIAGVTAFGRADDARTRAAAVRRERLVLEARTARAERNIDAPISEAERVAKSVTTIVEASDKVITESATTNEVLDRAVRLSNSGRRAAANELIAGEGATSVQGLRDSLARAQGAVAAAELATRNLGAGTP